MNDFYSCIFFFFQVMAFGLFLIDSKDISIYKMDAKKKINIGKIDRILKVSKPYHFFFSNVYTI